MIDQKPWLTQFKIWTLLLLSACFFFPFGANQAAELKTAFPKRANYFLSWELSDQQAVELAKWDLVILDMEHQIRNPDKILKMRQLNPHLIILAYLPTQEIRNDLWSMKDYVPLRYKLFQGIQNEWRLKRPDGQGVSWWPQTFMLNITDQSPRVGGQNWADYLANFAANDILGSSLWDGLFFDNTWNSLTGKVTSNLDINNDGRAEEKSAIEDSYQRGMNYFFNRVQTLTAQRYLLVGNDSDIFTTLNGLQLENFPYARGWPRMMADYHKFSQEGGRFVLINANTANAGGRDDYQKMRFGLASALLDNGYYSFDLGDQNHGQTWWYDEYDFYLGDPAGESFLVKNHTQNFSQRGLWRRDFKQGLVLVNSSDHSDSLDLGAEYERLKGWQDPATNNGVIVSSVEIPANDGLILLRPLDKLVGQPFRNGAFARLFNERGQNIRNGFFAYESDFKGGSALLIDDLDNNGELETIVISGNNLKIFRGESLLQNFYPFGASFKGSLSLAAADFNQDGQKELILGMRSRGSEIRIYNLDGRLLSKPFLALAKGNQGGINLAVADLNGNGQKEIIAGSATSRSQVRIFSKEGRLLSGGFYAYGQKFKGGVNVAAGDINGDGQAEIITGPALGQPEIRIFNSQAKQIGKGFLGATAKSKDGINVAVSDVDGDGRGEIISLSQDVFTTALK